MDPNQQQLLLGYGGGKKSTYVDDVFSTQVYVGNQTVKTINTGIDLAGEGGMVWFKNRTHGWSHRIWDTVRGQSKFVYTSSTDSQLTDTAPGQNNNMLASFDSNGVTIGKDNLYGGTNYSDDFVNWQFRKAPGFFDIVQYTGNGSSNHQISHNLESVPGCIMIKCTTESQNWMVYHKGTTDHAGPGGAYLYLNTGDAQVGSSSGFYNTTATSTHFTLGDGNTGNKNNATYIAYIFAGGESTAATASSIDYAGNGRTYTTSSSNDFSFGTGDFTIECWARYHNNNNQGVFQISSTSGGLQTSASNTLATAFNGSGWHSYGNGTTFNSASWGGVGVNTWHHVAMVRYNSVLRVYVDGTEVSSIADSTNYTCTYINIGGYYNTGFLLNGDISNFRVVKGTAVYTSSFIPPTEPLTNISGTVLLCNNDATNNEGSTVTPVALTTANGTARIDSPFDDPEGFKFGEDGDKNIIKCGHYKGASSHSTAVEVYVGFEPQWIIIKNISAVKDWVMFDTMRKWKGYDSANTNWIEPNDNTQEQEGSMARVTPTGFVCKDSSFVNGSEHEFIYIAIRRPDGYVGKPPENATKVFAIPSGKGGSSAPNYEGGNIVDFHLTRNATASEHWYTGARLMGPYYTRTDEIGQWAGASTWVYDFMTGYNSGTSPASWKSWQWKRHKGMDVVPYIGNSVQGRDIRHNMGAAPDMMWVKNLTRSAGGGSDWVVYVSGITHLSVYGSDPDNFGNNPPALQLNNLEAAGFSGSGYWDHTHPTSTHFRVGDTFSTNQSGESMIAFLFASIPGISKVGTYEGSSSNVTVSDVGFSPRFLITKNCTTPNNTATSQWNQVDTVRGFSAGNDARLRLNDATAPNNYNYAYPTSSGFVVTEADWKQNGSRYIYYAHA